MRNRMFWALVVGITITAGPASAGNIVLTGHDDDFHGFYGDSNARAQLSAMVTFASGGAPTKSLPVLAFDSTNGTGFMELDSLLTTLGIAHTTVNTATTAVTAGMFDVTKYSAIVVASAISCGGCDMASTDFAALTAQKAAIQAFVNAGGGIVGLAGADDTTAYNYVPNSTSASGHPPSTGFVQTSDGATAGIPAVNGDATHNYFAEPGTSGSDPGWKVFERNTSDSNRAETIGITGATIGGGGGFVSGVPEPSTMALASMGLLSLCGYSWRRRKTASND